MSEPVILLGHGSGGRLSHDLTAQHFLPKLGNAVLNELTDSAILGDELALTTDAYVVSPRFFPGGDLGRLAVCGTVNDLAMVGAQPLGLTAAFVLEEGLPLSELDRLVDSMAAAAAEAGVSIVAGDTKVVPRRAADGAFITTSGVGRLRRGFQPVPRRVRPGDAILISGTIGDHGTAVLACREGMHLSGQLTSDVAPLNGLVDRLCDAGVEAHALRDPTRGGVAQSLLEIAAAAAVRLVLDEASLPFKPAVRAACELLGLDALYVANEGKLLLFVPEAEAERALKLLRAHPLGVDAAIIGRAVAGEPGCEMVTTIGARRSLHMASGELLPRIC
jgi:hydrogenase expression/formation protein HypE